MGAWGRKSGLHSEIKQVPRKKGRASKVSPPTRSRRKHEPVNAKALQEDLQRLGFTPSLVKGKRKMGKRLGDKGLAYKMTERNESD